MSAKKEISRFTIKFNPTFPRQEEAMRILNETGRSKAALIADALHLYFAAGAVGYTNTLEQKSTSPSPHQRAEVMQEHSPQVEDDADEFWSSANATVGSFFQ